MVASIIAASAMVSLAQAQPASGNRTAVDPLTASKDPLATDFRRIEPGIAQHPYAARLTIADFGRTWSPSSPRTIQNDPATGLPHAQGFEYRAPGVRALIDRPAMARIPGSDEPVLIVPANTIYQLTPERSAPAAVEPPPHANYRSRRLDLRLSETADLRLGASQPTPHAQWRFPAAAMQHHSTLPDLPTAPTAEGQPPTKPVPVSRSKTPSPREPEPDTPAEPAKPASE